MPSPGGVLIRSARAMHTGMASFQEVAKEIPAVPCQFKSQKACTKCGERPLMGWLLVIRQLVPQEFGQWPGATVHNKGVLGTGLTAYLEENAQEAN